jgi:hypothetical protein
MRVVRGLWPDRNPLRRTLDRVEGVIVGGLAVAFLAGAPLTATATGHMADGIAARAAHTQQASCHQVPAVLLTSVPAGWWDYAPTVRASWQAPDGTRHTGAVPAPPDAKAGATVMVWIDAAGRLTERPLQPYQVRGQAVLAALLAPVALGLILLCAAQLAHAALTRRRLAAWEADWRATGPQWSRHR